MVKVVKNAQHLAKAMQARDYTVISGGTDNHLIVVDLRNKGVKGKQMQIALDKAGITVNKQMIPYDPEKPWITSGLRIGTTAITQRGLGEQEIDEIVDIMDAVVKNPEDEIEEVPFDYGFICLGMRANTPVLSEIEEAFSDTNVEIVNIGDSKRARRIIEGTEEGRNILNVLARHDYL